MCFIKVWFKCVNVYSVTGRGIGLGLLVYQNGIDYVLKCIYLSWMMMMGLE